MTVRTRGQGYGFRAERRGRDRTTGLEVLPPLRADREPASRLPLHAPAAKYAGGFEGAGDLPEFAGEVFVYAFAGAYAGKGRRRRQPNLMVAVNLCDNGTGRIVPAAIAET